MGCELHRPTVQFIDQQAKVSVPVWGVSCILEKIYEFMVFEEVSVPVWGVSCIQTVNEDFTH